MDFNPYVAPQADPNWRLRLEPEQERRPSMDFYADLGAQLLGAQAALMSRREETPPMQDRSLSLGGSSLTSGFDMNWLDKRIAAGSAEGQAIGGGSGRGGGQKQQQQEEEMGETVPTYDSEKYKGFWGGTKDFFGWGKGNRFGRGK